MDKNLRPCLGNYEGRAVIPKPFYNTTRSRKYQIYPLLQNQPPSKTKVLTIALGARIRLKTPNPYDVLVPYVFNKHVFDGFIS